MAYTWFNRFVAIRFMELHGYLDHGYRVLSHPEEKAAPEILEHARACRTTRCWIAIKSIDLKLDGSKDEELYRLLLIGAVQCPASGHAVSVRADRRRDRTAAAGQPAAHGFADPQAGR